MSAGFISIPRAPGSQWDAVVRRCGLAAGGLYTALLTRTCWRGGPSVDGAPCDHFGLVVVPVRQFAEHLCCDHKTVRRLVRLLEDAEFVTVTQHARRGRNPLPLVLRIEPIAGEMPLRGLEVPCRVPTDSTRESPAIEEDLREDLPQADPIYGRFSPTLREILPQFGPQVVRAPGVEAEEEVGRSQKKKSGEEGHDLTGRGSRDRMPKQQDEAAVAQLQAKYGSEFSKLVENSARSAQ